MARVLIVFASRHGQTLKIADHLDLRLRKEGHEVDVVDSRSPLSPMPMLTYDAFVLATSVNYGRPQRPMRIFVEGHLFELRSAPSAFLAVSAAAASKDKKSQAEAQQVIDEFVKSTGWTPTVTLRVAGALKYTLYPWLLRMMLRSIVRRSAGEHSGDTDTRRDYEYTDWDALDAFVKDFLKTNVSRPAAMLL